MNGHFKLLNLGWCCVVATLPVTCLAQVEIPEAPEEFAELIERGNVTYDFSSPRRYDAETHYTYDIRFNFLASSKRSASRTGVREVVTIRFTRLRVVLANQIRLSPSIVSDDFWNTRLIEHEFEHVRVNADPRVFLLIERVIRKNNKLQFDLPVGQRASSQQVRSALDTRIQESIKICERLVQRNTNLLDQITRHGQSTLESEPNFFRRLYTATNLKEQQFEALPSVASLLRDRKYISYQKDGAE